MRHNAQERGSWELHAIEGGLRFKLPPDRSTVVGRLAGSDLLLDDLRVSRRHAILSATPEGVRVLDAGSTWGTFVNERPVGEGSVAHAGERLRFGESSFEVRVTEAGTGAVVQVRTVEPRFRVVEHPYGEQCGGPREAVVSLVDR